MRISGKRERPSLNLGFFLAAGLLLLAIAPAAEADLPYRITAFTARTTNAAGADYTAAGGHPFQSRSALEFSGHGDDVLIPDEELKDAFVTLAPGLVSNPAAAPRCPIAAIGELELGIPTLCPPGSRVGTAIVLQGGLPPGSAPRERPVYNLITEGGYPAQFGFRTLNTTGVLSVSLLPRTESYGVRLGSPNAPFGVEALSLTTTLCSYGAQGEPGAGACKAPSGSDQAPFLSNPLDCSNPQPSWKLLADSWENAGTYTPGGLPDLANPAWLRASVTSPPVTGCDDPALASQFNAATIATKPLQSGGGPLRADAPAGLAVDLDFPQSNDPTDPEAEIDNSIPQAPEPRDIAVQLPAGLAISPSSADGLGACSDLASDPAGDQVHYDDTEPVRCPDSSKIGSAVATSPLLALRNPVDDQVVGAEPIPGGVYLLKPHPGDLPLGAAGSDGKFRLLIQFENPGAGINLKLPGIAIADEQTGQLTIVFTDNPQLPAKHLQLTLKGGPYAWLATPATCGRFETTSTLVPWSAPGTPDATPSTSFDVASGPNGSACAGTPGRRPFSPALPVAGTESNRAGAPSPFLMTLTRNDGEQELSSLAMSTPPGFSAKLAGVPYCSEAAIGGAANRSGAAEAANPSCPAASQIGTVAAGSGPGPSPYYVSGKAYLAGPYKGAPLSFVFIVPAVAGPFDLGAVAVRAAIFVDPQTAQLTVRSDPLPQILDGMPLRLRSISARIDRPDFTRNPTNCEPMSIDATVAGASGASASPSNRFQVGDCRRLGFKPRLALRLLGPTHRSAFPKVRATLRPRPGDANIAGATVTLPRTEFLENAHIRAICTRARYAAGTCPAKSIYGHAKAWSPLLDRPLEGPVYLRASDHTLPDLVASLDGQFHIDAVGRIDSVRGRIRGTLEALPDVPVSKFVLTMDGGSKGLLVNNTELCKARPRAGALLEGQNGKLRSIHPPVTVDCGKK